MRTLNLSDEQKKTLKLFAYYGASHGANTMYLTVYLTDGGSIDWIDNNWYSETSTSIEGYDKINNLIKHILYDTDVLDYYDYDGSGSLDIEIDIPERKMTLTGHHREWDTEYSSLTWENFYDAQQEFDSLFESLSGQIGTLSFEGSGDSGFLEDFIISDGRNIDCPSFFEDWCYDILGENFGGWEINEGSQGSFTILPDNKMIELSFGQNTEDNVSDGVVGYVEF
jgi:hypothetical protein